jgi:hypothetical protein
MLARKAAEQDFAQAHRMHGRTQFNKEEKEPQP